MDTTEKAAIPYQELQFLHSFLQSKLDRFYILQIREFDLE
jgi:hypothetical protein